MTAQTLLEALAASGLRVRVAGRHLAVRPATSLTPAMRALIATHRSALLEALDGPPVSSLDDDAIESRRLVFAQQIVAAGRGPIPAFCYRPTSPSAPGGCTSCGEPLCDGDGSFGRCGCCGEAARRALVRYESGDMQ